MKKRNTVQKKVIFSALNARCDHPSATKLYEDLREDNPNLSKATVYRVLKDAAEEGAVLRIHVGSEDRIDGTVSGHSHIICEKCHAICDTEFPLKAVSDLEEKSGYRVRSRHVEFYGLCPECRKEAAEG